LAEGAAAALLQPTLKDLDARLRGHDGAAVRGHDGHAPAAVTLNNPHFGRLIQPLPADPGP
jgi:hypothetical protein